MATIYNRYTGQVIASSNDSARDLVYETVKKGRSLFQADLHGLDLSGLNLKYGDFRQTNCSKTSFYGSNITGSDFRGADTFGADFHYSNQEDVTWREKSNSTGFSRGNGQSNPWRDPSICRLRGP